jgi:phosphatidylglycerol:prolipoprotein diacylglycerol transferase
MLHTIFPLYGNFAIHGYGFMISLATFVFLYFVERDPRFEKLTLKPRLSSLIIVSIIAALVGGRLLFFIHHPELYQGIVDFFAFFNGGLSILGAVISLVIVLSCYCWYYGISTLALFDLIALYAPLQQAIGRLGCLLAGCCYGRATTVAWSIIYTSPDTIAPRYCSLHPTQLYSAFALGAIFLLLYFALQYRFRKPGQLGCWYLVLTGIERWGVDFWRAEHSTNTLLSLNQYIAMSMIIGGLIGLTVLLLQKDTP